MNGVFAGRGASYTLHGFVTNAGGLCRRGGLTVPSFPHKKNGAPFRAPNNPKKPSASAFSPASQAGRRPATVCCRPLTIPKERGRGINVTDTESFCESVGKSIGWRTSQDAVPKNNCIIRKIPWLVNGFDKILLKPGRHCLLCHTRGGFIPRRPAAAPRCPPWR